MDKKPTDNEIKKALECCVKDDILEADNKACLECPMNDDNACTFNLRKYTLDLINRIQAENERLKENLNIELENYATEYDYKIKAEAYKEILETLKERAIKIGSVAMEVEIDTLVKEMVGDEE